MAYHLTGIISTSLFFLSILGLYIQLRTIWERKRRIRDLGPRTERPTAVISLNLLSMGYFGCFLFFLYGFSLERFNHYLVWPRLAAIFLFLVLLYELMMDRRHWISTSTFFACLGAAAGGLLLLFFKRDLAVQAVILPQILIVVISLAMAQGNLHQILIILRSGSTGGVALKSHQLNFLKDMGTISLGLAMGIPTGWPLIFLCGSDSMFKLMIMYLFRWVRRSPGAQRRRDMAIDPI